MGSMDSDDCYDSGADCFDYYSDEECGDLLVEDDEMQTTNASAVFSTLNIADIERIQEDLIAEISSILSLTRAAAIALLVSVSWNSERAQEEWFSDEEKMRRFLGMSSTVAPLGGTGNRRAKDEIECQICYEIVSIPDFSSLNCGHCFCNECWTRYVEVSIDDGIGCLRLRCPEPKCTVLVGQSTIETLIGTDYAEKYLRILRRSYVESKSDHKWCPAPDCETAVRYEAGEEGEKNYDVVCGCSHEFCFNCSEEAHRPVDCTTVEQWMRKNLSEAENVNWILAHTKQCPKCRKPIEKNQGCMHMTCKAPCNHQFCWLCLGDWSKHRDYYTCNTYEKMNLAGELNEEETRRVNAKLLVDRYAHYFERWATNRKAMKRAMEDLGKLQAEHFESLTKAYSLTEAELESVVRAWMQIKECRRVLEWTYAYGYYLDAGEEKKVLFEFIQGEAESSLEKLHSCAEEEIKKFYLIGQGQGGRVTEEELKRFHDYKVKLDALTNATENYFQELVKLLEKGVVDLSL
ncbi:Probable E3 ubiquitin-protein ligase ARI7 [Linum grandiflorum]